MFDRDNRPPEIPEVVVDELNELIGRLRRWKVDRIVLPEPPLGLRVPNLVRSYLQSHVRRCLMFLDGGHAEWIAGRPLVTELCTRSIYENVATICDFTDKLKPMLEGGDYDAVEKHVTHAAFVTRVPSILAQHGAEVKAPQILNQIDRMGKRYPQFRDAYDHLSDIVHPNGLGAVVYFSKIEDGVVTFPEPCNEPDRPLHSLLLSGVLLAFVEIAITKAENGLRELSATMNKKHFDGEGQ